MRCWLSALPILALAGSLETPTAIAQNAGHTLGDRVVAGYDQVRVHESWTQADPDVMPGNGRRLGGIYFSGGNGGYFSSGPGYGAYVNAVGPFAPYGFYGFRPWGYGYGFGSGYGAIGPGFGMAAGGYWPGFGYGRYNYYWGRPAIYSGNQLWGNNLQGLWNPDGLGVDPPQPANVFNDSLPRAVLQAARPAEPKPARLSNADAIGRAWRWISVGDKYFARQEYRQAYQRYKDASAAAPDVADTWLRQGQSMVAAGQYPVAAAAFKRGLKLLTQAAEPPFTLDDLYGDLKAAKHTHLESVADAADRDSDNGDLLFLVGLQLHFDGQTDRAAPFLERAAEIFANDDAQLARTVQKLAAAH